MMAILKLSHEYVPKLDPVIIQIHLKQNNSACIIHGCTTIGKILTSPFEKDVFTFTSFLVKYETKSLYFMEYLLMFMLIPAKWYC